MGAALLVGTPVGAVVGPTVPVGVTVIVGAAPAIPSHYSVQQTALVSPLDALPAAGSGDIERCIKTVQRDTKDLAARAL